MIITIGEESQRLDKLSVDFMLEESSNSDEDNNIRIHHPVWCSRGT